MESNIYYQLAQTECALDRCKAKLFKKNLTILGLVGVIYILGKAGLAEAQKYMDAKKERDNMAESLDKMRVAMDEQAKKEAATSDCCDGHVRMTDVYEKLKND